MSLPVVYLPAAQDDIVQAHAYYEQQRAGLGTRFVAAVRDQIERIGSNPTACGFVHQDVRAALVRRFPFVVYYRIVL